MLFEFGQAVQNKLNHLVIEHLWYYFYSLSPMFTMTFTSNYFDLIIKLFYVSFAIIHIRQLTVGKLLTGGKHCPPHSRMSPILPKINAERERALGGKPCLRSSGLPEPHFRVSRFDTRRLDQLFLALKSLSHQQYSACSCFEKYQYLVKNIVMKRNINIYRGGLFNDYSN